MDRAEWLAERRTGIGASDTAAILGVSPYTTPYQVWLSKLEAIDDDDPTEAMRWGTRLESLILDVWSDDNDVTLFGRGELVRSPTLAWLLATPDAVTPDGIPVEAKNIADWSWDEVPVHYRIQSQHQQIVCGADHGLVVVLHAGRHLETYRVDYDPDLAERIITTTKEFWGFVERGEAPPVEAEDNAILANLWPTSSEAAVEIPERVARNLWQADAHYQLAKTVREAASAVVKDYLHEADTAVWDQTVVATWRTAANGVRYFKIKDEPT